MIKLYPVALLHLNGAFVVLVYLPSMGFPVRSLDISLLRISVQLQVVSDIVGQVVGLIVNQIVDLYRCGVSSLLGATCKKQMACVWFPSFSVLFLFCCSSYMHPFPGGTMTTSADSWWQISSDEMPWDHIGEDFPARHSIVTLFCLLGSISQEIVLSAKPKCDVMPRAQSLFCGPIFQQVCVPRWIFDSLADNYHMLLAWAPVLMRFLASCLKGQLRACTTLLQTAHLPSILSQQLTWNCPKQQMIWVRLLSGLFPVFNLQLLEKQSITFFVLSFPTWVKHNVTLLRNW